MPHWKRLKAWWRDFEWPVVGAVMALALVLAHIGFMEKFRAAQPAYSFLDLLYADLRLFVLDPGDAAPPFPFALNLARFLAPLATGYTALQALAELFSDQLQSFRLRLTRNHVVICGLGLKGLTLARGFVEGGESVVVIEADAENDLVRQCRELGCPVLIGDASEPDLLRRAGVARARHLFALCGDDSLNAEIAVRTTSVIAERDGEPLACVVHIFDPELCALLRERALDTMSNQRMRVEFFNVFELGARILLKENDLLGPEDDGPDNVHLVIIGVGHLGETVALVAARQWYWATTTRRGRLTITLVDSAARQIAESLHVRYPSLATKAEIVVHELDVRSPEFFRGAFLRLPDDDPVRTIACVCLDDDSLSLSTGLTITQKLDDDRSTVVVRMAQDAGLAALLRDVDAERSSFRRLRAFALSDRTCRPEEVLRGVREMLARAIHEEYVRQQRAAGVTTDENSSIRSWDELPAPLKQSNRRQADDITAKLTHAGCSVAPLMNWDEPLFEFRTDEVNQLALEEHERWLEEKRRAGWRHGPMKDDKTRTHPCLIPYDDLPESEKEKDRNTVRQIPKFLASVGFRVHRLRRGGTRRQP